MNLPQQLRYKRENIIIFTNDCGTHVVLCYLYAATYLQESLWLLSNSANLGCLKCLCKFATGVFGVQDFSGFDRNSRVFRNNKHKLPYFDPVRMHAMHDL